VPVPLVPGWGNGHVPGGRLHPGRHRLFWFYEELEEFGWSRAEAIEDLRLYTDRVEMAIVTDGIAGPFEPVPLIVTRYRDAPLFGGHIVWNHRAFMTQLPAGEYLVRWTSSYPGFPDFVSTVRLLVTPV
jgi:hypothetical protein